MVDVSDKSVTLRTAVAEGRVHLGEVAFGLVKANALKKGDVLTVAKLAGIGGAKHTPMLIPLCHTLLLTKINVDLTLDEPSHSVVIRSSVTCNGQTGVEMEALTAVSVSALTVYDMCKAVTHNMTISGIRLVSKTGGKTRGI